nr:probable UDP-3-O-acyl-N-acetylglucosamine deacetylase 2, mitochondrial isoform X3 [Solanum lycopersicum]
MAVTRAFNINTARNSSSLVSWIPTGKIQQTVANSVQLTGIGLHSGKLSTVTILPELAGVGRYFKFRSNVIPASTDYVKESALCTTLCKDGRSINTVEHLLSALEATGVDNCSMQIETSDTHDSSVEAPEIGCQWFSSTCLDKDFFAKELASARTFCIYEQVEQLRKSGVIKGGSAKNAIVCSESRGWLNPPLRFSDEPCRHKVLDLIGDLSLLAHGGNQGLPVAHIIVYKPYSHGDLSFLYWHGELSNVTAYYFSV